jgi:four helix bundle protein
MRPHQRLDVWRKSIDFVVAVYEATEKFPRDEKFGLTFQLRRAAVSISANIAEGAGRKTPKEFAYFLSNSQGSASEVETELLIAYRLRFLSDETFRALASALDEIGRMLTGLAHHVRQRGG